MAKYISVLRSSMDLGYWEAVQWGETLPSVVNNRFYTAGINFNIEKQPGDQTLEQKQIIETKTHATASAMVIKLSSVSSNYLKLANNKATPAFIKKLKL